MLTLVPPPTDLKEARKQRVKQVLAGRDFREEAVRVDLHYTTLYDMARGLTKSRDTIEKFVAGFGLDLAEWLPLYGFSPGTEGEVDRALATVLDHSNELTYEDVDEPLEIRGYSGFDKLSPEAQAAVIRVAKALVTAERKKQGRE